MESTPFSTIESTEEFLELLHVEIGKTQSQIEALIADEADSTARSLEALRLVVHKLKQLERNTDSSRRLLGDLKMLRTLMLK